jgi:hypothetical protein
VRLWLLFLLSVDEAHAYFVNNTDRIARNTGGRARWWWLRSQGTTPGCFAAVDKSGKIPVDELEQDNDLCGVRPAFWISLDGLHDYLQSA